MLKPLKWTVALACLAVLPQIASAQEPTEKFDKLPLFTSSYSEVPVEQVLTIPQQRAKFAADQRMLRIEWENWMGYSPLRPNLNASYMSNTAQRYYTPSRSRMLNVGNAQAWYW